MQKSIPTSMRQKIAKNDVKMIHKSWQIVPEPMQNPSMFGKTVFSKIIVLAMFYKGFLNVEGRKSRSEIHQTSITNRCSKKWCKMDPTSPKMMPKWIPKWSKIVLKSFTKSIKKSIRNLWSRNRSKIEPWSAKGSPRWLRECDGVKFLGWRGPYTVRNKDRFDSKTATLEKGSRHAVGPKARRIFKTCKHSRYINAWTAQGVSALVRFLSFNRLVDDGFCFVLSVIVVRPP